MSLNTDLFPCLLISTSLQNNEILFCNTYASKMLGIDNTELTGKNTHKILSRASLIIFESYIRPLLIKQKECCEIQITLIDAQGLKIPSLANIMLNNNVLYWSIFSAKQRDKLYQELIDSRNSLEEKTEELEKLSRIDPLTKLLNRRAFHFEAAEFTTLAKRHYTPIAFVLIDFDYFKNINDTFGHAAGDELLKKFSAMLKSLCRETDLISRWGGEEFLVALYNSDTNDAKQFCQRLHEALKNLVFNKQMFTVSIGVSFLNEKLLQTLNPIEHLINEADIALYEAKNLGRNQTVFSKSKARPY